MSLPARSNMRGVKYYTERADFYRQTTSNGVQYPRELYESRLQTVHGHRKTGSKGQKKVIPGTQTVFKYPTTYARGVVNYTWGREVWVARDPGNLSYARVYDAGFYNDDSESWYRPGGRFAANIPAQAGSTELESEAIAKAIARMKDQKVGLGENLATLKQTTNMFAENAYTLYRACLAVKHGNVRRAWDILQDERSVIRRGADLFLQYKYGWKPLMSDIYGSVEEAKNAARQAGLLYSSAKSQRLALNYYTPLQYVLSRKIEGGGYQQAQVKLYGKLNGSYSRIMDGLGLANPLRLAWDLVPLSFVTDWLLPIGPCLDALIPPKGIDFVAGYCSVQTELQGSSLRFPGINVTGAPVKNTWHFYGFDRKVYVNWPKAGLYATKDPLKLANIASAIALIAQKLFK